MEYEGLPVEMILLITFLAPVILGLTETAKRMFSIKKDYLPTVAIIIGLLVGFAAGPPLFEMHIILRLWSGALAGLASTGLYEAGTKRQGKTKN